MILFLCGIRKKNGTHGNRVQIGGCQKGRKDIGQMGEGGQRLQILFRE